MSNDNDSEAGSDDSSSSSDTESEVTASEIKPAYKSKEEFKTDEEYEKYILENVKVGASVRFKDNEESRSEIGTVVKVSWACKHLHSSIELACVDFNASL